MQIWCVVVWCCRCETVMIEFFNVYVYLFTYVYVDTVYTCVVY